MLWSYGSGDARNDPRLSHASRAEGDVCLLSPGILQDASLLLSMVPNILDEPVLYNQTWSFEVCILNEASCSSHRSQGHDQARRLSYP